MRWMLIGLKCGALVLHAVAAYHGADQQPGEPVTEGALPAAAASVETPGFVQQAQEPVGLDERGGTMQDH